VLIVFPVALALKSTVPVAFANVPPVVVHDPPTDNVPVGKVALPCKIRKSSARVRLVSLKVNGPVPLNVTANSDEVEASSVAEVELVINNSEVLCVIVPPVFLKLPPTVKTPDGSDTVPFVTVTAAVAVALVSVMLQLPPTPLKISFLKFEPFALTMLPADVEVNTIGLPLTTNEPPTVFHEPLTVVVPVGSVSAPAEMRALRSVNVLSVFVQLPLPVKAVL
jgi:hypothetical protein